MKTVIATPLRAAVIYLGNASGMQSQLNDYEKELPELVDIPPPPISDTPPLPVQDAGNKNRVRDDFNDGSADA